MATAIVGESFGGSSFHSAYSDFTVQVRGVGAERLLAARD